jgi:hypothetical protein
MPRKGYDYSWSRPNLTQLRADGGDFVIRYVSWDTHGKNLTGKETAALGKAGIPDSHQLGIQLDVDGGRVSARVGGSARGH